MRILEQFASRTSRRKLLGVVVLSSFRKMARAQELEGAGSMSAAEIQPPLPDMALGPADARVTVIEYASASCPNCRAFYESHFGALQAAYIKKGKIRFIVREFPHNDAGLAAFMVARCALPDKYFEYLDTFFTMQDRWTINPHDGLLKIALDHGMTASRFESCIKDNDLAARIHQGRNIARSHGVDGVPTFFINGVRHAGENSYEGLSAEIDKLLAN